MEQKRLETSDPSQSPPLIFDRQLLRKRRRDAANGEPVYFLLDYVRDEMVDRLSLINRDFETTLIAGLTPGLVDELKRSDSCSKIITMDLIGRIKTASNDAPVSPHILASEEYLPIGDQVLDCYLSVLGLHLVNDLIGSLIQIRRCLKPDGLFITALLGGQSLHELRSSFLQAEEETAKGISPRVIPFADIRDLGGLLQRAGFALPVVDTDKLTVRYDHVFDLMRDIKNMGAANPMLARSSQMMRRDTLERAAQIYSERFSDDDGRIRATFEIVWLIGWVPHHSQQKPLRPGSAKMRLAEALKISQTSLKGSA